MRKDDDRFDLYWTQCLIYVHCSVAVLSAMARFAGSWEGGPGWLDEIVLALYPILNLSWVVFPVLVVFVAIWEELSWNRFTTAVLASAALSLFQYMAL